jgi:uncharacterized lipoprotein YehR (DUF1307 family)
LSEEDKPEIVWKVREKHSRSKFLRFEKFEEAARYYDGTNPPIKYVDGVPELMVLSKSRAKKRIKAAPKKIDTKALKRIDVKLKTMTVKITSKHGLTMRNVQDAISQKYPDAKAKVNEIKHIKADGIGNDMNRIRSALDQIKMSVDRTTNEIY